MRLSRNCLLAPPCQPQGEVLLVDLSSASKVPDSGVFAAPLSYVRGVQAPATAAAAATAAIDAAAAAAADAAAAAAAALSTCHRLLTRMEPASPLAGLLMCLLATSRQRRCLAMCAAFSRVRCRMRQGPLHTHLRCRNCSCARAS